MKRAFRRKANPSKWYFHPGTFIEIHISSEVIPAEALVEVVHEALDTSGIVDSRIREYTGQDMVLLHLGSFGLPECRSFQDFKNHSENILRAIKIIEILESLAGCNVSVFIDD